MEWWWTDQALKQYQARLGDEAVIRTFDSLLAFIEDGPEGPNRGYRLDELPELTTRDETRISRAVEKMDLVPSARVVYAPLPAGGTVSVQPRSLAVLVHSTSVPADAEGDHAAILLGVLFRQDGKLR